MRTRSKIRFFQAVALLMMHGAGSAVQAVEDPPLEALHKQVGGQLRFRLDALQRDLSQLVAYVGSQALGEEPLEQVLSQFKYSYPPYVGVFCKSALAGSAAPAAGFPLEAQDRLTALSIADAPADGTMGILHLVDTPESAWILFLKGGGSAEHPVLAGVMIELKRLLEDVCVPVEASISGCSLSTVDRLGHLVHVDRGQVERHPKQENRGYVMDRSTLRIIRRAAYSRSVTAANSQWMLGLHFADEPAAGEVDPLTGRWMGAYTEKVLRAGEDLYEHKGGKLEALSMQQGPGFELYLLNEGSFQMDFTGLFTGGEVAAWESQGHPGANPAFCSAEFDPVRKALKGNLIRRQGDQLIRWSFYLLRASP